MFHEPGRSPYDWQFFLAGFPVRVTWLFWVISALWGYDWARGLDEEYHSYQIHDVGFQSPGPFVLLFIWVAVSFLSILIHELGHSLAMRYYGIASHIILYHFGGLAVPDGTGAWRGRRGPGRWGQIIISAAGPLLQLAFGVAVAVLAQIMGFSVGQAAYLWNWWIPWGGGELPRNAVMMGLIDACVLTSIFWSILNLIPVLPMDGGNIAEQLISIYQAYNARRDAIIVSIVVAIVVAMFGFTRQMPTLGTFFVVLAILNYQSLQDPFSMR
jgi:stage IV sporulation protein FB